MAWPAPRRRQADFLFFLSSSTSVNSASTTSSALPEPSPPRAAPPGSPSAAAPSWACLYMASPSFIEACASALVLAVIAAASLPLSASLRSAIAFSIARRSPSPTFEPCSASAFSVAWTSASAWFFASTSALRFLSSSACDSASLTMRWMSASDRRHAARRRRQPDQIELAKHLVIGCHLAFALEDADGHCVLIVLRGREHLALLGRNRGVAINQPREHAAERLDAERERRHVEQQHVLDVALQHAGLDRRADRDDLVGVDALVRLLAEQLLDHLLHLRHARHAADQNDLVDLGRG